MEESSAGYALQVAVPLVISLLLLVAVIAALLFRYARGQRRGFPDPPPPGEPWSWPLAGLVLTVVFLAANHLLVRGVGVGIWDVFGQFQPYFVFVADHARAGRFVTWDAWSNGGLPLLGDPQLGAFSPVVNLLGLVFGGTGLGFRVYWLLMWWMGGIGMLLLGRHLGSPPWGACAVALGFVFCGVYMGNAEHTPWITAYSFLPLVVWRLDVALKSARVQPAIEAGALWGLSALAGYPGVIVITGCFCALWTLGRVVIREPGAGRQGDSRPSREEGTGVRPWQAFAALVAFAFVGAVVLAPTYLSFFHEGAGMNSRAGPMTREMALGNALDPGALVTLASPHLSTLKFHHRELWPASDVSMVSVYMGVITPVLALFALVRRPTALWRWWLVALAALSLAAAVGEALPVRGWLYDWFFPMRFFRHSAIFRLYFIFSVSVLALIATRDLVGDLATVHPRARRRLLAAAVVVGTIALAASVPFLGSQWEAGVPRNAVLLGQAHFFAAWAAMVLLGIGTWILPIAARAYPIALLLVALASADAILTCTISIPTTLRIGPLREEWHALEAAHSPSLDLTERGWERAASACPGQPPESRCRRNDQLITKVPVLDAYASERNPLQMATVRHPVIRASATGMDRIWFARDVVSVRPTERAFAAFAVRAQSLGQIPIVIHARSALLNGSSSAPAQHARTDSLAFLEIAQLPAAQRLPAKVLAYSPDELILEVEAAEDGWMLVTDRWARGWQVRVNGEQRTIYGGNFIFRAIPITGGNSRVHFTFHALGFPWLAIVSWSVLLMVGIASGKNGWALRRSPRAAMRR